MVKQEVWRIKYRVSPDEYVYTHAVAVDVAEGPWDKPVVGASACGRPVPEHMAADIHLFDVFINQTSVDCPDCWEAVQPQ